MMQSPQVTQVGMAQLATALAPHVLKTLGLGSCVGVCLYDARLRIGGMVHIMLPEMALYQDKNNASKYADTGIPLLVREMGRLGCVSSRLTAKLAGGAQMFAFAGQSDLMRIGTRNVDAARLALHQLAIPVVAEHVGGNFGRTIELSCETGALGVRTIGHGSFTI